MRSKKYPLEPLIRVRQTRVDESVKSLSSALSAREEAERTRQRLEAERARSAEAAAAVRALEAARLSSGTLVVADLQRQGAWEVRTQWDDDEKRQRVSAATDREKAAQDREAEACTRVAQAEADAKVVTKDRARWSADAERAAEAAAEEGAAEAWRPGR